jgi:hypothetical protein
MVPVDDIQRLAGAYLGLSSGIELRQAWAEIALLTTERDALVAKIQEVRALLRYRQTHALEDELKAFAKAHDVLDRASQAAQPAARRSLEKAAAALMVATEKFFGIERTFK